MKRILFITVVIYLLLWNVSFACEALPSPFDTVREYALGKANGKVQASVWETIIRTEEGKQIKVRFIWDSKLGSAAEITEDGFIEFIGYDMVRGEYLHIKRHENGALDQLLEGLPKARAEEIINKILTLIDGLFQQEMTVTIR